MDGEGQFSPLFSCPQQGQAAGWRSHLGVICWISLGAACFILSNNSKRTAQEGFLFFLFVNCPPAWYQHPCGSPLPPLLPGRGAWQGEMPSSSEHGLIVLPLYIAWNKETLHVHPGNHGLIQLRNTCSGFAAPCGLPHSPASPVTKQPPQLQASTWSYVTLPRDLALHLLA